MTGHNIDDTIAAISTMAGESGIGIVRLSGSRALEIADRIFVPKDGRPPSSSDTHTLRYGWVSGKENGKPQMLDEALLSVMRAPRSYTREDVVEINCHGGMIALRRVLELVLEQGARLAEPGEFTKRAFLNGRIDLSQAEAVLDIIRAKTDSALRVGIEQLRGSLGKEIKRMRKVLLDVLTVLEADIDFPEDDMRGRGLDVISERLRQVDRDLKKILSAANKGRILREGVKAVICGRPNVGKSSLLNALLKEERAIVTPVSGTTRDTIEDIIDIKGIPVRIVDTAGIIEPRGLVQKKAVARSREYIDSADLVILLFDGNKRLQSTDKFLIKRLRLKKTLAVINKIDLPQKIERQVILKEFISVTEISAKKLKNIEALEDAIARLICGGGIAGAQPALISNLRHFRNLRKSEKFIAGALKSLDNKLYPELIAENVKEGLAQIDEILGKNFSDDLLERIFSQFCIGK